MGKFAGRYSETSIIWNYFIVIQDGNGKESTRFQNVIVVMMKMEMGILEAHDRAYSVACEFEVPEPKRLATGFTLPYVASI